MAKGIIFFNFCILFCQKVSTTALGWQKVSTTSVVDNFCHPAVKLITFAKLLLKLITFGIQSVIIQQEYITANSLHRSLINLPPISIFGIFSAHFSNFKCIFSNEKYILEVIKAIFCNLYYEGLILRR